jgi:hypothetical protein
MPAIRRDFCRTPVHSSRGNRAIGEPGNPLSPSLRKSFEEQFQTSLADVRLHDSSAAATLARRRRANALTLGSDILFAKGRYRPMERAGRMLLAHEITHVLQQRSGSARGTVSGAEGEALSVADRTQSASPRFRIQRHVAQADGPLLDAASLKAAIEDELDDFFVGIDNTWPQIRKEPQPERDKVRFDKVLERNIRHEVNEKDLLKTYLLLTYQREESFPAHFKGIIEATYRWGTHEARIYSILRGVSPAERKEMQDMPGLVEVLEDEMSGNELQKALQLLYGGVERQGADVSTPQTSTHLEISERFNLDVSTGGSFDDVVEKLSVATNETDSDVLLHDSSLWSKLSDEFDKEETWYLRMIARYRGADHFPKLTGPNVPAQSFIFLIWEDVKGWGTKEDELIDTLKTVKTAPGMTGGKLAAPKDELLDDPWFVPMLEDELSGDDLNNALAASSASRTAASGLEKNLKNAIDKSDLTTIRKLLTDAALPAVDLTHLRNDPVIIKEMGDKLSGAQLCETGLLLKYGSTPFPPNVTTLLSSFQKKPVDVASATTFLQSLVPTAGALDDLRREPGMFFMMTNSDVHGAELGKLLGALHGDEAKYQTPGSEGFYRTHEESVQTKLPINFAGAEVRIPIRCNIDRSQMRGKQEFDTDLLEDWLREIDRIWNGKFVLREDGHQLALVFSPYMGVGVSAPDVTIFVLNWKGRSFVQPARDPALNLWVSREMHLYLDDLEPKTVAHEFGHVLGNPDEYDLTPSEYSRITGKPAVKPPASGTTAEGLMGSQFESTAISPRHVAPALGVINAVRDVSVYPNPFVLQKK